MAQAQRTENFAHLTHGILLVIAGDVFDQLLFQRGSALCAAVQAVAREHIDGCADGALKVYARLFVKVFILGADKGPFQIIGNIAQLHPDTVAVAAPRSVFVAVAVIQNTGLGQLQVVQIQHLGILLRNLDDIFAQGNGHCAAHHGANAAHHHDGAPQKAPESALFALWPGVIGTLIFCRCRRLRCALLAAGVAAADPARFVGWHTVSPFILREQQFSALSHRNFSACRAAAATVRAVVWSCFFSAFEFHSADGIVYYSTFVLQKYSFPL